jgi:hypothetical protein
MLLHNLTTSLFGTTRPCDRVLEAACAKPVERLEGRVLLAAAAAADGEVMALADFNGDGRDDRVIYQRVRGRDSTGGRLKIMIRTDDGFERADAVHVGRVTDVAVGDFNNDGDLDLAVTQQTNREAVNKRGKELKRMRKLALKNDAAQRDAADGGDASAAAGENGNNGNGNGGSLLCGDDIGLNGGDADATATSRGLRLLAHVPPIVDGDGDTNDQDPDPDVGLGGGGIGTGGDGNTGIDDDQDEDEDDNDGVTGDDDVTNDDDEDNDQDNNGVPDDSGGSVRPGDFGDRPGRPRPGGEIHDTLVFDGDRVRRERNDGNGNGDGNGDNDRGGRRGANNDRRRRVLASQVLVALGNGNGTFDAAQSVTSTPVFGASRIRAGDFNDDGNEDLLVRARNTNENGKPIKKGDRLGWIVFYGNGDGTFSRGDNVDPDTLD